MRKRILGRLLLGLFLLIASGGLVESASHQAQASQASPENSIPAMYRVGKGNVGLFHHKLTLDEAKNLITGTYGGRLSEAREPAGEGTTARVVSAYFKGASDNSPSIKITLDNDGNIYRIEALSPEFRTTGGLHVGSTWAEIRSSYPQAKVTVEEIIAFHAPDDVTCRLGTQANPNWQKIKAGQENPPDDLKITGLFTYPR